MKPLNVAFVVSERLLKHPRTVKRIARALLKSADFLKFDRKQSRKILASSLSVNEELIDLSSWEQLESPISIPNDILLEHLITV